MNTAPKIASGHPFLNSAIVTNLANGVVTTLHAMAKVTSIFEKTFVEKNWKAPGEVSVFIDLQSPPSFGQVRFHFSRKVLAQLYKNMMNEEIDLDSDDLADCLGEISNVCYGYTKGELNKQGYALKMALPNPGKTVDLPELISHYPHIIIPFTVCEETCYIQIVIL